jgi:hypothetical protein
LKAAFYHTDIWSLEVPRRVSNGRIAASRVPTKKAVIGQRHASERFRALTEANSTRQRRDYPGASRCIEHRVLSPKISSESLAVFAVANDATVHTRKFELTPDRGATALDAMLTVVSGRVHC